MTRVRVVAAVVVVVLLAGCGAADDDTQNTVNPALDGTPTPTPSPTATPEPTPTATPPVSVTLPDALAGDTDAAELAVAHERNLGQRSRTVVRTVTVRDDEGRLLGRNRVVIRDDGRADSGRLAVTRRVSGPRPGAVGLETQSVAYWGNDSVTASRTVDPDGAVSYTFDQVPFPVGSGWDTTGRGSVALAFELGTVTDARPIQRDPTVFAVTGQRETAPVFDARNVSLSATVDESGVVRAFELSYTQRRDGAPRQITRTLQLRRVGETPVSRPSWFGQATGSPIGGDDDGTTETATNGTATTETQTTETATTSPGDRQADARTVSPTGGPVAAPAVRRGA